MSRTSLVAMAFLAACTAPRDPEVVLATTVEVDVPSLAAQLDQAASAAAQLAGGNGQSSTSDFGLGDCLWDMRAEGRPVDGRVLGELVQTPCGGNAGPAGALDLVFDDASLSGQWTGSPQGEVEFQAFGHRDATVRLEGRDYDVSWQILSLDVFVDKGAVQLWHGVVEYTGFAGSAWLLDVLVGDTGIEGTLTGPSSNCLVASTLDNTAVLCNDEDKARVLPSY
jgi:hypothetical protein